MLRREVPLEQFELGFETAQLDDPIRSKESYVTILRFLERDIAPIVDEISATFPTQNELDEHVSRGVQVDYFRGIESTIEEFVEAQNTHVTQYLDKALKGLEQKDSQYVYEMSMAKLGTYLAPAADILSHISQILADHYHVVKGHEAYGDERTSVEDAVDLAGEKRDVGVDELMKGE
jgi:hypothetical protein